MKKGTRIAAITCAFALAATLGTGVAFAYGYHGGDAVSNGDGICNQYDGSGYGNYVDDNGDGVCDNAGSGAANGACLGNGACDGTGTSIGHHGGR